MDGQTDKQRLFPSISDAIVLVCSFSSDAPSKDMNKNKSGEINTWTQRKEKMWSAVSMGGMEKGQSAVTLQAVTVLPVGGVK